MSRHEPRPLAGKVALVAGATRGAGRGIAVALGEAGATVYCSGRSVRGAPASGPARPETIEETAELVTAAGGEGVWARTDHTVPDEVRGLVQCIREERGRLDVLVNDVWGGDELTEFGKTFWSVTLEHGRDMIERAVWSHVVTAHHAAPLMIETGPGLIVEITDGDTWTYRGNVFYDMVKTTVARLAWVWAYELRKHRIASVAVTPGFLRSEAMLDRFGVTEETWRDAVAKEPDYEHSETPRFVGRAVAALAADPKVFETKNGRLFSSWQLSREYGFTDVDGRRPDWGAHFVAKYGAYPVADEAFYAHWRNGPVEIVFPEWP